MEPLPTVLHAPERRPDGLKPYCLNGTQDMLELFDLMPLYDQAVRPYLRPDTVSNTSGTSPGTPTENTSGRSSSDTKRVAMPKSFVHYVGDLPGKVRPPKRTGAAKHQPKELAQLLIKPEYTYTPITPFDKHTLSQAFSVDSSSEPAPGIDTSVLEADEHESPIPKRKPTAANSEQPDQRKKRVVLISKKKATQRPIP
ncbi:hypothetical protein MYAM1_003551 [Malassezia yamatoensis]|uniref:Mediator of RNA polymerase II transcription subunit 19 n=1 Tax=Malassezia yamatoensis TaxID=253288 RepID=A0AAJ6CJI7_9BASI|nr:hypothetical protein MYAM1_003551 [Malassezia yamatoensis]